MRHVILIHAHKNLAQLNMLVGQLAGPEFSVWVNVDAKSAIDVAAVAPPARVVRERIAVHWGQWSQVEATLNSLREILAAEKQFGKVVFISAQDFPLLPNTKLRDALDELAGCEVLECAVVGPEGWNCAERFEYFHLAGTERATRLLARAMRACGIKRVMPSGMRAFGGSSWWALSRPCVASVLARIDADPSLVRFFRTVSCPDELFFQTLVMDSPFAANVIGNNFRFIAWPAGGARNPRVLTSDDFESIAASRAHFCRKLDMQASAGLLPVLVRLREARESSVRVAGHN